MKRPTADRKVRDSLTWMCKQSRCLVWVFDDHVLASLIGPWDDCLVFVRSSTSFELQPSVERRVSPTQQASSQPQGSFFLYKLVMIWKREKWKKKKNRQTCECTWGLHFCIIPSYPIVFPSKTKSVVAFHSFWIDNGDFSPVMFILYMITCTEDLKFLFFIFTRVTLLRFLSLFLNKKTEYLKKNIFRDLQKESDGLKGCLFKGKKTHCVQDKSPPPFLKDCFL